MKVDLHTHTISSGHAFSTINENAQAASEKGIKLLAVTDHGPAVLGSLVNPYFFDCKNRTPQIIHGVRVLFGVEANIINADGDLDLSEELLNKLDFVAVGFHADCGYVEQGIEKDTEVLIKVMQKPYVKIIVHPYNNKIAIDMEKVALASITNNVLLEINASYFYRNYIKREGCWERLTTMIRIFKENNQKMIIGSDAHHSSEVGRFEEVIARFAELGITEDDVFNNDVAGVLKFLNIDQ